MTTRVSHVGAHVGWKNDPQFVYIGRPTKWGNPFTHQLSRFSNVIVVPTREEAILRYEAWLLGQPKLMAALGELRDKTLLCWCSPNPCHGNILARLAEETREPRSWDPEADGWG